MSDLKEQIEQIIATEDVALFMKGTPQFAMCGNSQRALEALRHAGAPVTRVGAVSLAGEDDASCAGAVAARSVAVARS